MVEDAQAAATFALGDRDGLHARPCARIARTAQKFRCSVVAEWDGHAADASSVLELLRLNAPHGARIAFRATGPDAPACIEAIGREVAQGGP